MEEEYWRTKSRIQWLHVGDRNTKFFHEKTKQRRCYNRITAITDNKGIACTSEEDIYRVIVEYFESLYRSENKGNIDMVVQHLKPRVTAEMNQALTKPVTEEELNQVIHQMARDKAPGPDGFNPGYFQDHWSTIQKVMRQMGFSDIWCKWIMKCISTVTYFVLINGHPVGHIKPQRGIRQDDSLLFYKATDEECTTLLSLLNQYEQA
ncbi:PREDICTED: uncharacterized protein LOC104789451 isoform X2 [Camelina sativa]|uniref:Uncharacterized protein LOC104789451 isoform X2 n=1 Tax=Camelina sativa TaxID=90675 RepID=A0ABM0ZBV6_CAMSA|nr:PREDICTED: uncharacterized protein LOC104789451 isoform X2 [Camelina sativa]